MNVLAEHDLADERRLRMHVSGGRDDRAAAHVAQPLSRAARGVDRRLPRSARRPADRPRTLGTYPRRLRVSPLMASRSRSTHARTGIALLLSAIVCYAHCMIRLVFVALFAVPACVPPLDLVAAECEQVSVGDSLTSLTAREDNGCCVFKSGPITSYAELSSHEAGPAVELECCTAGRTAPFSCGAQSMCASKPQVYIVGTPRTDPRGELEFKQFCCCAYVVDGVVAARHVTSSYVASPN